MILMSRADKVGEPTGGGQDWPEATAGRAVVLTAASTA